MIYLSRFFFPDADQENGFFLNERRTCYDTFYPFQILPAKQLSHLDFEPITILYGGNGSGKTTVLNIIAEKLQLERDAMYNRSNFFEAYASLCDYRTKKRIPAHSRIITSDDVFDYMLNLRCINNGIDRKREELFDEYLDEKYSGFHMQSLDDYEQLKKVNLARRKSQSQYVRSNLMDNIRTHSNGESAFAYFSEKIKENRLYLLDEPENSLAPARQQELAEFLVSSARFFGCQFVIATHSPFLLSMQGAKIYDLDESPVETRKWTALPHIRAYYELFRSHAAEFESQ